PFGSARLSLRGPRTPTQLLGRPYGHPFARACAPLLGGRATMPRGEMDGRLAAPVRSRLAWADAGPNGDGTSCDEGSLSGSGSPRHGPGRSGSSAGAAGPSASSAAGHGGGGPAGRARARAGSLAGEAAQAPAARAHADWQGGAAAARSPRLQNRKLCERGGDAQQPEEAEEGVRPTQTEADVHTGSGRAVSREDHDEVTDDELAALMLRMPKGDNGELTSVGSTKHAEGTCKPCAFFSTQVGCQKGIRCDFCHILHRRKDRRRLGKQKRERYRDLISRVASGSKADPEPSRQSAGSSDQLPGG
ncbi:unnamed protein product, partial [Prorocentrum cordatum]